MATKKQIEANRLNAARSTGPRTASGKARASNNARRHGFTVRAAEAQVILMMALIQNGSPEDLGLLPEIEWEATAELARAELALAQIMEHQDQYEETGPDGVTFRLEARYRAEAESRRRAALHAWIETMKQNGAGAAL